MSAADEVIKLNDIKGRFPRNFGFSYSKADILSNNLVFIKFRSVFITLFIIYYHKTHLLIYDGIRCKTQITS